MRNHEEDTQDPLQMIHETIVCDERDWAEDERSAVISAIVCGWREMLPQVADRFGWSEEHIARLSRLRAKFIKLCPVAGDD